MAEEYTKGTFPLWYRSTGFKEGLIITADFINPLFQEQIGLNLTEHGRGLYFINYTFQIYGIYVAIFYENGIKKITQNFKVMPSSYPFFGSGNLVNRSG